MARVTNIHGEADMAMHIETGSMVSPQHYSSQALEHLMTCFPGFQPYCLLLIPLLLTPSVEAAPAISRTLQAPFIDTYRRALAAGQPSDAGEAWLRLGIAAIQAEDRAIAQAALQKAEAYPHQHRQANQWLAWLNH
jgi:hypothetical protein